MPTTFASFQQYLESLVFPLPKKEKKRDKTVPKAGYSVKAADDDSVGALGSTAATFFYRDSEYPELIITGSPESGRGVLAERLSSLFPAKPLTVTEHLDEQNLALVAFRADSYFFFAPPAATSPVESATSAVIAYPTVYVKKTFLRKLDELFEAGALPPQDAAQSGAESSDTFAIGQSAEFVVARLFLPPRISVSGYTFATVVTAVTAKPLWPLNTRHLCFDASWIFSGVPLSVKYHFDISPTAGAQAEAVAKASVAAIFREALAFWGSWKRPVEKPDLKQGQAPSAGSARSASLAAPDASPDAVYLVGELRGELARMRCTVEMPRPLIGIVLKMTQVAPVDPSSPSGAFDVIRANDSLFLKLKDGYRKALLANPKGAVLFEGITVYGLLSVIDDADKALLVQNFLVPRYELQNLPLFFYYHVASKKSEEETEYRLRPAFPVVPGEIERFLPEAARREWNYNLSRGCMHRISTTENLVAMNGEAVLEFANEAAAGRILVSGKTMRILREEILAPLDAAYRKELDELNGRKEAFEPLRAAKPKAITDLLAKLDTRTVAMACFESEDVLKMLDRGMSQTRRSDIRTEIPVTKKRYERGELSVRELLDAKKLLLSHVAELAAPGEETVS